MWRHASVELGDEIGAANAAQALLYATTLLGFVPEEELALGQLFFRCFGAEHGLQRVRIVASVPRFGGVGEWRRGKVLHLLEMEIEVLGDDCQLGHIFLLTAWVAGDEVGDELLTQALFTTDTVEKPLEVIEL